MTAFSDVLNPLVELAAPYWAGELEIVQTYFDSARRSPLSDRLWLRRQCYKEIWGSGVGDREMGLFQADAAYLNEVFPRIDKGVDRHDVLQTIDGLRSEFAHYCLFADIHDSLGGAKIDPAELTGWEADNELARMRYECRDRFGPSGLAAVRFTEGGCGTMYRAGMQLAGRGDLENRIARACEQVYTDEVRHMRAGIVELAGIELSTVEKREIFETVRAILVGRLRMRNEQFDFPVSSRRIDAIDAGQIEPIELDRRIFEDLAD